MRLHIKILQRSWWRWQESNLRLPECKSGALPTELHPQQIWLRGQDLNLRPLGYEPNELPDCSTPRYTLWWAWVDSNYRPHAYQACALTNWATGPHLVTNLQSRNKFFLETYSYLETHLVIKRTIEFDVWKLDMRRVSCNLNLLIKVAVLFY